MWVIGTCTDCDNVKLCKYRAFCYGKRVIIKTRCYKHLLYFGQKLRENLGLSTIREIAIDPTINTDNEYLFGNVLIDSKWSSLNCYTDYKEQKYIKYWGESFNYTCSFVL